MNKRLSLTLVVACLCLSVAEQASAYYAAHMGRFTSRDPNGEIGRFAMEMPPDAGISVGLVDRDQFDPMAAYDDGLNLYQYVQSRPVDEIDPMGLKTGGSVVVDPNCREPLPIRDEVGKLTKCRPGQTCPADGVGSVYYCFTVPVSNRCGTYYSTTCVKCTFKIVDGCTAYVSCATGRPEISVKCPSVYTSIGQSVTGGCISNRKNWPVTE